MIEEPPENELEGVEYEESIYHLNYYKNLPSLHSDAHTTITHTQPQDGRSQTILAIIYQPPDVMKTKLFACGGEAHPGYVDNAMSTMTMRWQNTVEESPWNYPCYPDC